ncbi:hypothetical protein EWE75_23555 [Sphingomonas populi]|uniref:Uncharacterized protein n=1 Tax=Sphingomonas populi TaxID=2484750 RepID=A0A4V2DBT5_9SPHN|nr:hypothetical protein EWE75_23555 [Sphingomonas populi]
MLFTNQIPMLVTRKGLPAAVSFDSRWQTDWSLPCPSHLAPRTDFDASAVRAAARRSKDGGQARRLLALAAIYGVTTRK